jgi:hypothetical protein
MIFLDRLIRAIAKDMYLPIRCYASKEQLFAPDGRCVCQTICRKPSGGTPQPVYIQNRFSKRYTCCLDKKQ